VGTGSIHTYSPARCGRFAEQPLYELQCRKLTADLPQIPARGTDFIRVFSRRMPQLRSGASIYSGACCRQINRIKNEPRTPHAGRCGKRGEPMISSNRQAQTNPTPETSTKSIRHYGQKELARRWNLSHRTLERWRCDGQGPRFIKLNGRVLYRAEDVIAFEEARLRDTTSAPHDCGGKR
jgi:hypothetical protein